MALIPNRWELIVMPEGAEDGDLTEGVGSFTVENGYYHIPGTGEDVLLNSVKEIVNKLGQVTSRIEEEWTYEVEGGPATKYHKRIYSPAFLPGFNEGGEAVLVETVDEFFWTFTPYANGENLGSTKFTSGVVVYDEHTEAIDLSDPEVITRLTERGMRVRSTPSTKRIVQTQRFWSEAVDHGRIVHKSDSGQHCEWQDNVFIEEDIVQEEWEKWIIWRVKKDTLKSRQLTIDGPRYIKKADKHYAFPYDIQPPQITSAYATALGIVVEVEGGGAAYTYWMFTGISMQISIPPERYKLFRRAVSELPRPHSENIHGWWEEGSEPPETCPESVFQSTTTDFAGVAADPIPAASMVAEPHDDSPPPQENAYEFIGEKKNLRLPGSQGFARFLDSDVQIDGVYEYVAVAVIGDGESEYSGPRQVVFTEFTTVNSRMWVERMDNGDLVAEMYPTEDPCYLEAEYGEPLTYDVPAAVGWEDDYEFVGSSAPFSDRGTDEPGSEIGAGGPPETQPYQIPDWDSTRIIDVNELIRDVAERRYAHSRPEPVEFHLKVRAPILGLEQHQILNTPTLNWRAFVPGLILNTSVSSREARIKRFSFKASVDSSGNCSHPDTEIWAVLQ